MRTFCKRLVQYFTSEIVLAALTTFILTVILKKVTGTIALGSMFICLAIHFLYILRLLRLQRKYTKKKRYYKINISVFLIFATVNLVMAYFNLEPVYTYLFLPYKMFTLLGETKLGSAFIVNLIMLVMICIVPWIYRPSKWNRTSKK
ncbi:MAG: hypothetical protein IKW62_01240 [Clostridia bacterium]|nr:hypothetical protein [Clostridia bacterium]